MPQQENSSTCRLKSFKNHGRDAEEMRRRRTEVSVELRKQKKEDQLLKRRNVCEDDDDASSPLHEKNKATFTSMSDIIEQMDSNVGHLQIQATQQIRKILSRERKPPIDAVIEAGAVPRLVAFLTCDDNSILQFEAAWALTNIASGTAPQTKVVVDAQSVPAFIHLLSSPKHNVAEQAVWALGNIAGDGSPMRDYVIKCGVIKPLLALMEASFNQESVTLFRNVIWTISNLCRNNSPPPPPEVNEEFLPVIVKILDVATDVNALGDACWALSYMTNNTDEGIELVIQSGVVPRLAQMIYSDDMSLVTPALRAIGNIVTGNDVQTQSVIDGQALPALRKLLNHSKINIQKEAAWALSNITAGTPVQIEAVINSNIVPLLVEGLANADMKVQKELLWAVTNITSGATKDQIAYLINAGVLPPYCKLLTALDPKLTQLILDGLNNILSTAQKCNELERVCIMIEECGGLDLIELCQKHDNESIYTSALDLIEKFFGGEEEDEDINVAPADNGDTFEFPITSPSNGFSL